MYFRVFISKKSFIAFETKFLRTLFGHSHILMFVIFIQNPQQSRTLLDIYVRAGSAAGLSVINEVHLCALGK